MVVISEASTGGICVTVPKVTWGDHNSGGESGKVQDGLKKPGGNGGGDMT